MYLKFYKHGCSHPYKVIKNVSGIESEFTEDKQLLIHVYCFGSYKETILFHSYYEWFVLNDVGENILPEKD